jgi:signal transduction histidine kinase
MKKLLARLYGQYLSPEIELRAWNFNLLALIGIAASVLIAISGLLTGAGWLNAGICLAAAAFACFFLRRAKHTGRYQRYSVITVVVVFLVFFPVLFFTAGGYHSGMPSFFIFAVIFTVFMLDGKKLYILAALEIVLYTIICLIAFFNPKTVHFFAGETDVLTDVLVGFFVAVVMICLAVIPQFHRYDAQQKELLRLDKMKTEFLGNISHELKTPLAVMSGHAQTAQTRLKALPESEETLALAEKMTIIVSAADALSRMVEQVLNVTKIDEGRMVWDFRPCRIGEIIRHAVRSHFSVLNKNKNELLIHDDPELPEIFADAHAIEQVMINLIANAARHTQRGTITITAERLNSGGKTLTAADGDSEVVVTEADGNDGVLVTATDNGGGIAVTVADTGTGILPERLPHIFERYNRPDQPGETDTGTGLGLYVCKQIIEAHGGEISAESEAGKGTAIRFTLPAQVGQ